MRFHCVEITVTMSGSGFPPNAALVSILFNNRYMFWSYDHLQVDIYIYIYMKHGLILWFTAMYVCRDQD
jgi:hypothetical protein